MKTKAEIFKKWFLEQNPALPLQEAAEAAMEEYKQQNDEAANTEQLKQMNRCINALALELHESVWNDVNRIWNELKKSIQSHHTQQQPLPPPPIQ